MTEDKETTIWGHSFIWFGAAISIAEILTGTLFAPLGLWKATAAIVLGHALGCLLLYYSGVICARNRKCAMENAKLTFGNSGGRIFAGLNVLQLVGWTAVMISLGSQTANLIIPLTAGQWFWQLLIGVLIIGWLCLRFVILEKTNLVTMPLLCLLAILLSINIISPSIKEIPDGTLSFGEALELSIAMPVSWLPLIGDYTCNSSRPRLVSLVSAIVYFIASCWMYLIGLFAVLCLGENNIAKIMSFAGLGIAALIIVILSTVTTAFLDAYSAGVSFNSIIPRLRARPAAGLVCLIAIILAIICDTNSFEAFLYWIGSIFVPMAVVQICDEILLPRRHSARHNILLWLAGFAFYRLFLFLNLPCGSTIPDIIVTSLFCVIFNKLK